VVLRVSLWGSGWRLGKSREDDWGGKKRGVVFNISLTRPVLRTKEVEQMSKSHGQCARRGGSGGGVVHRLAPRLGELEKKQKEGGGRARWGVGDSRVKGGKAPPP